MEILSKFRPVQSLVSVYMLVIVQVFGMLPMRAIFLFNSFVHRNISQKGR